ncbi:MULTISPECIES: plasmid transfer protein TraA [unclassified Streptomyces]|uniref:plasmid transfer protein TraA n=1 Tax=unclassified Streptomyces TaxID=2593676 RepID=UPI0038217269
MADNGSANRATNRQHRPQQARRPLINENGNKSDKFASAGAAVGGFVGSLGSSFVPPINLTVNNTKHTAPAHGGGGGGGRPHAEVLLPSPEFTSPAQVRQYCNTLRAAAVTLSIEVAMGAEILKGVLAAVPDPQGRAFGSRIRAQKVARKMQRSSDALRDAAKNAAAAYSVFQQEFEEEINRVRHQARRPQVPRIDWNQQ